MDYVRDNKLKHDELLIKLESAARNEDTSDLQDALPKSEKLPSGDISITLDEEDYHFLTDLMLTQKNYLASQPQMLLEMALVYASALFDALISDALYTVFRHIPERLRSGRTLTAEEALGFVDRTELIAELSRREIGELTYKNIEKQVAYLQSSFGVRVLGEAKQGASVTELAAVRERRNLVAHNNGIATAEYVARFDKTIAVGGRVVKGEENARADRKLLFNAGRSVVQELRQKLAAT